MGMNNAFATDFRNRRCVTVQQLSDKWKVQSHLVQDAIECGLIDAFDVSPSRARSAELRITPEAVDAVEADDLLMRAVRKEGIISEDDAEKFLFAFWWQFVPCVPVKWLLEPLPTAYQSRFSDYYFECDVRRLVDQTRRCCICDVLLDYEWCSVHLGTESPMYWCEMNVCSHSGKCAEEAVLRKLRCDSLVREAKKQSKKSLRAATKEIQFHLLQKELENA